MRLARLPQQRRHRERGPGRSRGRARPVPAPRSGRGRHPATTTTRCSGSAGCRSSTWTSSHQPLPYDDGRYWLLFNGEIYNYLELRERAGPRARRRASPPTGTARRSSPRTSTWGEQCVSAAARHVRVPDLGQPGAGAVRGQGLVRDQAAVHDRPTRAARSSARRRSRCWRWPGLAGGNGAELDTRSLQHYLTLQYVPEPATHAPPASRRIESGTAFRQRPGGPAGDLALLPSRPSRSGRVDDERAALPTRSAR